MLLIVAVSIFVIIIIFMIIAIAWQAAIFYVFGIILAFYGAATLFGDNALILTASFTATAPAIIPIVVIYAILMAVNFIALARRLF